MSLSYGQALRPAIKTPHTSLAREKTKATSSSGFLLQFLQHSKVNYLCIRSQTIPSRVRGRRDDLDKVGHTLLQLIPGYLPEKGKPNLTLSPM